MPPARDLVDLLDLSMGARLRDVGSGTVTEAFRTRFGDVVEFTRDFLIGLGTKP